MKDNKLIAEFMGAEWHKDFFKDVCIISPSNISYKFHKSWDWLMPVVNQCYNSNMQHPNDDITQHLIDVDIEATYQAVVEFINEYNKQEFDEEHQSSVMFGVDNNQEL